MENGSLIAVILLVVAFTFWRPLRRVRTALGLGHLTSTGHAFLIFGFLLGLILDERPVPLARDIGPIVAFIAGWVGFATGMRFELRVLRPVPGRAFAVALLPAAAAAVVVAGASLGVLLAAGVPMTESLAAALVLAAAAASSGPTLAAVVRTRRAGRSHEARAILRMIEFSAGLDEALVVLLSVVGFALFRPEVEPVAVAWLVLITAGGGALLGVVTWLFLGGEATSDERMLLGLAMLAFTAGAAGWMLLSPATVAAIAAFVLANIPGERARQLFETIRRVERPAVVILMTVIGFHLAGVASWIFLPLTVVMIALRLGAKYYAGRGMAGPIPGAPGLLAEPSWALGLAPQGNFGLVVALSFFHVWADDVSRSVLAAVAVAGIINELIAPSLLLRALRGPAMASTSAGGEA